MSAAAAAAAPADAGGAKPKGKKKLMIIIVAVLVLLLGGGGAAMVLLKKKPPATEDGEEASSSQAEPAHKAAKVDLKHPPTFVPLDPFVVNLADKDVDRYAQIGITLQLDDAKLGEEMKPFMPAIRNGILMIIAHKTAKELQERGGKEMLAGQIQREAGRSIGLDIEEPDDDEAAAADDDHGKKAAASADDEAPKKKKKKKKKKAADDNPIRGVLFSNFIIQ